LRIDSLKGDFDEEEEEEEEEENLVEEEEEEEEEKGLSLVFLAQERK